MYFQVLDAEWQIRCWYLAILVLIVLLAKIASLWAAGMTRSRGRITFLLGPSLCATSWQKRRSLEQGDMPRVLFRFLITLSLIVAVYGIYIPEVRRFPWWLQSYLTIVPFWLLLETIDALCRLLWLPSGRLVPVVNASPWLARSVSEFWGRRWNRLFGDWLWQVVFLTLRRKPQIAVFSTFLMSGLLHELLVSLPLQIVYGRSVWGWLTGYFLLQYLAMYLERHLSLTSPVVQRVYVWLVVLGPAPLVLNPGTLLIFHLGG